MRRHGPVIAHCTNSEDFPWFIPTRCRTGLDVAVMFVPSGNMRLTIGLLLGLVGGWWSGILVSALASISEVNLHLSWLDGMGDRVRVQFPVLDIYFGMNGNQPATQGQLSLPPLRGR